MSPQTLLFRAICLSGISIMTGCATHATPDSDQANRLAADKHYDLYYGMPPAGQQRAAKTGKKQGAQTQGMGMGMVINQAAPKTYVVKKGDTLWGIAQKYLHTPSYWPEIWDKNQRLRNPHLIYPGDTMHFGYHKRVAGSDNGMKLQPRIRVERTGNGEPLETLASFLAWPRVLDDASIKNAPYLLASRDDHTLITKNDRVYIKNLKNPVSGSRYAVYHPQKPVYDPETKALLGHQVDYVGYAKIDRADKLLSSATILEAQDAIRKGDRLLPPANHQQALRAPIQIPRHKVRGEIISQYQAKYLSTDCMIIVINKGRQDNIKPGYSLGVYTDGKTVTDINRPKYGTKLIKHAQRTQLPPEKVAEAIIYSIGDKFSYGLIVNSQREVKNGDKIGNP